MTISTFERRIINGAKRAQQTYSRIADGHWLSHAPEHFLSHEIARSIARGGIGNFAYLEMSPRRLAYELKLKKRGPRPHNERERFDVVVWHRITKLKAIIEVKRAWRAQSAISDAKKLIRHMKLSGAQGTPYLLVYTEHHSPIRSQRLEVIRGRLEEIEDGSPNGWSLIADYMRAPRASLATSLDGKTWAWGIGLYRYDKPISAPFTQKKK